MKAKKTVRFKYAAAFLIAVVLMVFVGKRFFRTEAVFNEDGVHIDPAAEENSMLIIGTHLIHMHALTDELYQIAEASASDSSQTSRYYKSELADGRWMDITDAASLSDIMESGRMVDEEEISALFLTHRTGADGITRDLRTGQTVSVFDIRPLYDVETLPELEPLKLQYDMLSGGEPDREMKKCLDRIERFFEETKPDRQYDGQMEALQAYYIVLCENNAPQEEKETVSEVMGKLDCSRRALVYEEVSEALQEMADEMSGIATDTGTENDRPDDTEESGGEEGDSGENEDGGEDEDSRETYPIDQALLTAIQDSGRNLSDSLTEAQGNALAEGDTVMDSVYFRLGMSLTENAVERDHRACDGDVQNLLTLRRIMQSEIYDGEGELAFLETELLPSADAGYAASLSMGVSQKYQEALDGNASHVVLENIMAEDMADCDGKQNELQFYIQAAVDRMDGDGAAGYIKKRMEQADYFSGVIPEDAYAHTAQISVESHLLWLQTLLTQTGGGSGELPLNRLYEEKADLREQMMEALDDLDLDRADRLEALIEAKENEIQQVAATQTASLNRLYEEKAALEASDSSDTPGTKSRIAALDRQIAIADAGLTDGTEAANIEKLKSDAKKILQSGGEQNLSALETSLDGLIAFLSDGHGLAGNALKELYKDMAAASFLEDRNEYEDLMEKMEDAIAEYGEAIRPSGETLSPARAVAVLEDALGGSLGVTAADSAGQGSDPAIAAGSETKEPLSPEDTLAAVMALAACASSEGNKELQQSASALASSLAGRNDMYIFEQKTGMESGYVSIVALADYKGWRYLWNDTKKTAILSKGSSYYQFTAFRKQVRREGENMDEMEAAVGYAGILYLPPAYVYEQFGCRAYAIQGTDYAVLTEENVAAAAEELAVRLRN